MTASAPGRPGLDLAFSLADDLPPQLCAAAGPLAACGGAETCWREHLHRWLAELAAELPPPLRSPAYSIGLGLIGDGAMAQLNETWRGVAGATDVLAFAALEAGAVDVPAPPPAGSCAGMPLELGDILISLETAARQASRHGHDLQQELLFLASHGLLHLLGWDHPDQNSLEAMLRRQRRLIRASA